MLFTSSSVRGAEFVTVDVNPSLFLNYTYFIKEKAVSFVFRITTEM